MHVLRDAYGKAGVFLGRDELERWAGRPLSDVDVAHLATALPESLISKAVAAAADALEVNFRHLFREVLRDQLGFEAAQRVETLHFTGWQLVTLTSQVEPFDKQRRDETQERCGLDDRDSRYRRVVSALADYLDGQKTLLHDDDVIVNLETGEILRA